MQRLITILLAQAAVALLFLGIAASAWAFNFDELTALADGALQGDNVEDAVPGFDIRLLREGQVIYHQSFGDWALDRPAKVDSSTKTPSSLPHLNFWVESL